MPRLWEEHWWHLVLSLFFQCGFYWDAAAAAKSLQSCLTLCDPITGSPPVSPVSGFLQARALEWVAISFSNAWKWKVKMKSLSRVWLPALQLTRLLRPWDFPGKSTGVGRHCLLHYWDDSCWIWLWVVDSYRSLPAEPLKVRWILVLSSCSPWTGKKPCDLSGVPGTSPAFPPSWLSWHWEIDSDLLRPDTPHSHFSGEGPNHSSQIFQSICRLSLPYPGLNLTLLEDGWRMGFWVSVS